MNNKNIMERELQDKAWNLLEEKGLKLGERMMVRSHFADIFKEEYPFIGIKWNKGDIDYYYSEYDQITNLNFETKEEVILANALYLITKGDNFNINDFIQQIKYTLRILNHDSRWTE